MSDSNLRARLSVNVTGCALLIVVCIPMCLWLAWGLAGLPPPKPGDPDGGKAEAIYTFGIGFLGLLGLSAFVSLLRSRSKLRQLSSETP